MQSIDFNFTPFPNVFKLQRSSFFLLQNTVNLVPREAAPRGFQLVSADKVGKKNQFDLVELAEVVQKADQFTRATAGSKLTVIAEQVTFCQSGQRAQISLQLSLGAVSARASKKGP